MKEDYNVLGIFPIQVSAWRAIQIQEKVFENLKSLTAYIIILL